MTKNFTALTYDQAITALVEYDAVFSEILKGIPADEIEEYFSCSEASARIAARLVRQGPDVFPESEGEKAWTPQARMNIAAQIANRIALEFPSPSWRDDLRKIILLCEADSGFLEMNRVNFPEIETLNEVPGEA